MISRLDGDLMQSTSVHEIDLSLLVASESQLVFAGRSQGFVKGDPDIPEGSRYPYQNQKVIGYGPLFLEGPHFDIFYFEKNKK